jgi:hypothetical protein
MWVPSLSRTTVALLVLPLAAAQAEARQRTPPGGIGGLPPERVVVVQMPPPVPSFQMGFEGMHVIDQDGDLAHPGEQASSAGLRFIFREGRAIRQHLTFAHHWEQEGAISRRGFRLDLLSLGFPIPMLTGAIRLSVEPVLRVFRGEVLFVSENAGPSQALFRLQSGFALSLNGEYQNWFASLEPLSIDLRYLAISKAETRAGLSRIWSVAFVLGREF